MAKTNLKTLAYSTIRKKIVTCEYAPGTFLNEEILTEALGLSRTPIRDAISRLEQEGLVEIRPKHGITVTPLSINDINMIFEIRSMYEPYILKNYGDLLPDSLLNEYYRTFSPQNIDSRHLEDNDDFYELDSAFHLMVVNASPNIYLKQNYSLIRTLNERFRYMTGRLSNDRLAETFKEHMDIIVPCLQKDWDTAAEKMAYHLEESKKATFRLVLQSNGINL